MSGRLVVTVDGPAGSGKTACGRLAARRLGLTFISSGAYYRALTWAAGEEGVSLDDTGALCRLAAALDLTFEDGGEELRVLMGGRSVTDALKDRGVTVRVRHVAGNAPVRAVLNARMRLAGGTGGILAEGRDMGSLVFPAAQAKFFLEADLGARAARRLAELRGLGDSVDLERLREEIATRDDQDRRREAGPLVIPAGAVVIDTSGLTIEDVVARIVSEVTQRAHAGG